MNTNEVVRSNQETGQRYDTAVKEIEITMTEIKVQFDIIIRFVRFDESKKIKQCAYY